MNILTPKPVKVVVWNFMTLLIAALRILSRTSQEKVLQIIFGFCFHMQFFALKNKLALIKADKIFFITGNV